MKRDCPVTPLKRLRYFSGELLTADDFQVEQNYFLEKHRRHNRYLHGFGVVCGLEVSTDGVTLQVDPGLALNCAGEEIPVCAPVTSRLPREGRIAFVRLSYLERETDPVPVSGGLNGMEKSRVEEGFEIILAAEDPCRGHHRSDSRWLCCGGSHGIPIAKLKFGRGRWTIDRRFLRPCVR